ncbi:MAG: AI-2E family transporter, partial [Patescibacteria group bacterium]
MSPRSIGHYFLLALLGGTIVLTFYIFKPFLAPLILAGAFAIILHPLYDTIRRKLGNWPSVASLITVLIGVICILVPLGFIGTQVGLETAAVYTTLTEGDGRAQITSVVHTLEDTLVKYVPAAEGTAEEFSANITAHAQQALSWFIQHLGAAFTGIASLFLSLFIFFIALYFL